ncbi:MAG: LON peptidase substrate-binding domain-containing protein, partial [Alphaproteobacteria bacterium]
MSEDQTISGSGTTTLLDPGHRQSFPVLPLRVIVVFPHMIVPLFVGREKSVKALEHVMQGDKQILLVTQR